MCFLFTFPLFSCSWEHNLIYTFVFISVDCPCPFEQCLLLGFSGIWGATDDAGKFWRKDEIMALEAQTDKALVRSFSKQTQNIKWAGNALPLYLHWSSASLGHRSGLFCARKEAD